VASSACDHPPVGRPLIGLTSYLVPARFGVWDTEAALLPAVYVDAVTRAGGRPVLLPPVGTWDAAEVADLVALAVPVVVVDQARRDGALVDGGRDQLVVGQDLRVALDRH